MLDWAHYHWDDDDGVHGGGGDGGDEARDGELLGCWTDEGDRRDAGERGHAALSLVGGLDGLDLVQIRDRSRDHVPVP